jgi:hypothetical protein
MKMMSRHHVEVLLELLYQASKDRQFSTDDQFIIKHALEVVFHQWRRIRPKRKGT